MYLLLAAALAILPAALKSAFGDHPAAFVLTDTATGETFRSDPTACAEPAPPCSTFKIWNTAIGLELGLITDPDALFWKWDGQKRFLDSWSQDQTLRTAFATSCFPAYQALARQIGAPRMQAWLDKLNYGDKNISAGIDVFWLPEPGRSTILISPDQQAALIAQLVQGKLPLSERTLAVLKGVMTAKKTGRGTLYGKTGTGNSPDGTNWAWYVGYIESGNKTYAFATLLKAKNLKGPDARAATEKLFTAQGLLE